MCNVIMDFRIRWTSIWTDPYESIWSLASVSSVKYHLVLRKRGLEEGFDKDFGQMKYVDFTKR